MPINMDELLPTTPVMQPPDKAPEKALEPVLCQHCGRTASNGISCEGYCVADSNY
jgi:hypothetical protein